MVSLSDIDAQLTKLSVKKTFFCKPEIRELRNILHDGETIERAVTGRYHNGFALLVATKMRLLLIDKKPLYLTVEDIRYDMISEVDINARLFNGSITLFTVNKQIDFSSTSQLKLRELVYFVQKRVMELRQYHQEPQTQVAPRMQFTRDVPQIADAAHQVLSHIHVPQTISSAVQHTRGYIPSHLSQAVGATATKLASRIPYNPNPYTKGPLVIHQRTSTW